MYRLDYMFNIFIIIFNLLERNIAVLAMSDVITIAIYGSNGLGHFFRNVAGIMLAPIL